jgi:hypothetical protein
VTGAGAGIITGAGAAITDTDPVVAGITDAEPPATCGAA